MKKAGIWIDHRQAYLEFIDLEADEVISERIASGIEKHVRFTSDTSAEEGKADDQRDDEFAVHLNRYYDEVILHLVDTDAILLFGPGEAKQEFAKRLTAKARNVRIISIETVDKMTEPQIKAKLRDHFHLNTSVT
jgi:stalled ribosome rescue protein Dom34